ncbi:MAG: serine hydrolase, partial [Pseudomonadota bacterium]
YADTGYRVVGHRGAVEGYRSLILFDPDRDAGVVALWNSNARTPVKVQFEVMDMLYGLPDRNWLDLDAGH